MAGKKSMAGLASGNIKGGGPKPAKAAAKPAIKKSTKIKDKTVKTSKKVGLS